MESRIRNILLFIFLFASSAFAQNIWTPELQVQVKPVASVQVSPDGRRVVYAVSEAVMTDDRSEFVSQIWIANTDGTGSSQLTSGDKSSTNPKWSPAGGSIAFTSNRKNNRNNLYVQNVQGVEAEAITDLGGSISDFEWSPDGRSIAFTMPDSKTEEEVRNDKGRNDFRWVGEDPKMVRLYVVPVERNADGKREVRKLTTENYSIFGGFDWSPDSKTIAFSRVISPILNDVRTADVAVVDVTAVKVSLLAHTASAEFRPMFSPDGKSVALVVCENTPNFALVYDAKINIYPAAGGLPKILPPVVYGISVQIVGWSNDGRRIFFSDAERTIERIYAVDVATSTVSNFNTRDEVLSGISLNSSGTVFGYTRQTSEAAPEAFISPVDKFAPVQVSRVNAEMSKMPVGKTEVLRWKSSGGQEIEGLLTYPVGYRAGTRVPLILYIHGGPDGTSQQFYPGVPLGNTFPFATFAERGFAILRPNPRGSGGYGSDFSRAIFNDWGGVDYRDVMSGVDKVIEMGVADENRLALMGPSYGGYLGAWIVTQTKRFKAAAIRSSVINLMSFPGMSDLPGLASDHFGGQFWEVPDNYIKRSPIFHVKNVSTPTLIIHGEADPRVPVGQSYEFYYALKTRGVPTRFMVQPRQPHSPREPKMQIAAMQAILDWFEKYVEGK